VSGQGNHWTPNNLDYRDSLIDSPANNFATLNSIASGDYFSSGQTSFTLSEGNLKYGSTGRNAFGTMAVSSGKWYFEWVNTNNTVAAVALGGLLTVDERGSVYGAYYNRNGNKGLGLMNTGATETAYGATWTDNDVIGVAVDMDAATPTVTFYKNGSSQGAISVSSFANKTVMPWIQNGANTNNMTGIFNFGQDSTFAGARPAGGNQDDNGTGDFAYAPPAGYLALCTANLPTPTIIDGSEHFNTVLYNGNNNTGSQSVTGVGFQPDFLWLKERTSTNQLYLVDSVRGDNSGVMRTLYSSLTIAEEDTNNQYVTEYGIISSLDSDGFTVDSGSANSGATNLVGRTYAAWNWKAGGTAVSNTDGSITSSVSANPDAGFAVGTYTGNATAGATIGHSLGATPEMVIVKRRTNARDWAVYHKDQSATPTNAYLLLNSTAAVGVGSTAWNNGTFTSSVFTIGSHELVNFSGDSYVFYAFRGIEGYSKVGSYVGNGSADGTFVYTGFRPAWVMVKRTDAADDWHIYDDTRDSYNPEVRMLAANLSDAENVYGTARMDFLCNGVKMRANASTFNASGGSYIYLAFAERPFKYANAR
jgi:hypothetical protein